MCECTCVPSRGEAGHEQCLIYCVEGKQVAYSAFDSLSHYISITELKVIDSLFPELMDGNIFHVDEANIIRPGLVCSVSL